MNAAEARADEAEDRLRSAVEARKQSEPEHDARFSDFISQRMLHRSTIMCHQGPCSAVMQFNSIGKFSCSLVSAAGN